MAMVQKITLKPYPPFKPLLIDLFLIPYCLLIVIAQELTEKLLSVTGASVLVRLLYRKQD